MNFILKTLLLLFFAVVFILTFLAAPWLEDYARRAHRKMGFPAERIGIELPGKPTPRPTSAPTAVPTPSPEPTITAEPPPSLIYIRRQELNTARLWNGIYANRTLETPEGDIASVERERNEAYSMDFIFKNTIPRAAETLEELKSTNPELPTVLPDLGRMLENAKVSRFFGKLYEEKLEDNRDNLSLLNRLVSRHNFYDCNTILDMRHPDTGRRLFLIQAEMDVVTDGTDPDRTMEYDTTSPFFQPMTAYGWPRRSRTPENPLIPRYQERIKKSEKELAAAGTSADRKRSLRRSIDYNKRVIADLRSRSFLVAHADPFIVIPLSMRGEGAPQLGDYAAVIYEDRIYPALMGEYGPAAKMGEASLRICREIDPKSSGLRRPISDLKATYLVFPDTAEKPNRQPDLDHWHKMVSKYLKEIGGTGVELHRFKDILATPTPSPTPTPTPAPTPTPTPTPAETAAAESIPAP